MSRLRKCNKERHTNLRRLQDISIILPADDSADSHGTGKETDSARR